MLRAASGTRLEALWVLALTTGMRLGELLALRWDAVELGSAPGVQVKHTLFRGAGGWSLEPPKSREARRRIDLSRRAIVALEAHRAQQAEERLALGPAWADHGFVFTDVSGEPLSGTAVYRRQFAELLDAAELPASTRFHDLRHTFATLLLLRGVHVKIVSSMLGHSTIRLTLDTYSHVLPGMQKTATDAMDAILG